MAGKHPASIEECIRAAPREGQPPHLRRLYAILKSVTQQADEAIKWGVPLFVEPRFLFAFSADKTHLYQTAFCEVVICSLGGDRSASTPQFSISVNAVWY